MGCQSQSRWHRVSRTDLGSWWSVVHGADGGIDAADCEPKWLAWCRNAIAGRWYGHACVCIRPNQNNECSSFGFGGRWSVPGWSVFRPATWTIERHCLRSAGSVFVLPLPPIFARTYGHANEMHGGKIWVSMEHASVPMQRQGRKRGQQRRPMPTPLKISESAACDMIRLLRGASFDSSHNFSRRQLRSMQYSALVLSSSCFCGMYVVVRCGVGAATNAFVH